MMNEISTKDYINAITAIANHIMSPEFVHENKENRLDVENVTEVLSIIYHKSKMHISNDIVKKISEFCLLDKESSEFTQVIEVLFHDIEICWEGHVTSVDLHPLDYKLIETLIIKASNKGPITVPYIDIQGEQRYYVGEWRIRKC